MKEVTVSKMQLAIQLYNEIFAPGYKLDGKTQRAVFIERAITEIEMTKNGASTYYQNISNKVNKGMKLYHYNKPTKKTVDKAEKQAVETAAQLEQHRWYVVNEAGEEVNSFESRNKAQVFAKDNNYKWMDRNKAI